MRAYFDHVDSGAGDHSISSYNIRLLLCCARPADGLLLWKVACQGAWQQRKVQITVAPTASSLQGKAVSKAVKVRSTPQQL